MVSFVTRMPAGFAGFITREAPNVVEMQLIDATNVPVAYGLFVKMVAGKIQGIQSGDAATVIYGALVRPFPYSSATDAFGAVAPTASSGVNILRQGYFSAVIGYGAPAANGIVYARVDTGGHGGVVGSLEATADSTHNVVVVGAIFTGPADATNVAEIRFNL